MQETLAYIESYFTQTLSSEEKEAFELRCEQDEAFAQEVAFYLTTRSAVRELLMEEKQKTFAAKENTAAKAPVKKITFRKWLPYAAAACVLFIAATFFYLQSQTPARLAANYIYANYIQKPIGITMDASHDSMQLGIEAYNSKDYKHAVDLFEGVRHKDSLNSDAIKYAGLAYLQTKNYDKALECFEELAAKGGLYNAGDILTAATLLQRNTPGDKGKAKRILENIILKQEEGSKEAKEWLNKL